MDARTDPVPGPSKSLLILPQVLWDRGRMEVANNVVGSGMLRYAALYWDWARLPAMLGPGPDAVSDYVTLRDEGFLHPVHPPVEQVERAREDIRASQPTVASYGNMYIGDVQFKVIDEMAAIGLIRPDQAGAAIFAGRDEPIWLASLRDSLEQIESDAKYTAGYSGPGLPSLHRVPLAIEFRLYEALGLPIPVDTPMADVLEYRVANGDALTRMRVRMEEAYRVVRDSPEPEADFLAVVRQLKLELEEIRSKMNERGWRLWNKSFVVQLSPKSVAAAGALGAGAFETTGSIAASLTVGLTTLAAGAVDVRMTRDAFLPRSPSGALAYYIQAGQGR